MSTTLAALLAIAVLLALPAAAVAGPQRATLAVEGMTCTGCEDTIESVLQSRPGVTAAQADRSTQTVTISYDGAATAPAALVTAINDDTYYRASLDGSPTAATPASAPGQAGGDSSPLLVLLALAGAGGLALLVVRVRRERATSPTLTDPPDTAGP